MKKIKLIVATIAFMFVLAIATTVNATTYNASITYGDVKDGKVVITATFDKDLTDKAKESATNKGYTIKDSKNLTKEVVAPSCGFWKYSIIGSSEETYYLEYSATPFEMEVQTSLSPEYTIDNLTSSDSSVIKIEDGKFVAVKEGTATITGTANLENNKKINISYKGTVIDPNGTTPGDDSDKKDPTPTPGDDSDKKDPTPTPGDDSDKKDPTPTPGDDSDKKDPAPTPGDDSDKKDPTPSTGDKTNSFKWIDGSKVKATVTSKDYRYITVKTDIKPNENASYYAYFSKKADENVTFESIKNTKNYTTLYKNKEGILEYGAFYTNLNELSGDTYMYIIEQCNDFKDVNYKKENVMIKAQKVEKAKLPNYGNRLDIYLYDKDKNIPFSSMNTTKTRKMNYKIGKITSNDILRAFKNESSDSAFEKLYKYAKDAKILKEGTIGMETTNPNIVSDMKLENDGYYFIYLSLDTENGKYEPLDDIAIYQAYTKDGNTMVHFKFNTIKVSDSENKDEQKDKKDDSQAPTDIPQTGATATITIITVIILAVGTVGFIGYRKYNGIK